MADRSKRARPLPQGGKVADFPKNSSAGVFLGGAPPQNTKTHLVSTPSQKIPPQQLPHLARCSKKGVARCGNAAGPHPCHTTPLGGVGGVALQGWVLPHLEIRGCGKPAAALGVGNIILGVEIQDDRFLTFLKRIIFNPNGTVL